MILSDESLYFATQRKQMDLHIRLWDVNSGIVRTCYFGSEFMGHGTADDMWKTVSYTHLTLPTKRIV